MIRTIEELSMNAWPALQTVLSDGWVLRFADGYTRRSNSVYPIYPSTCPVSEKIEECEKLYRARGQDVVFKITSDPQMAALDETLAARGYQADAHTSIQVLDLSGWQGSPSEGMLFNGQLTDEWLANYSRMSTISEKNRGIAARLLTSINPDHCFAMLQAGSQIVACGLGVVQAGFIGFYDIVTDPAHRRQGYARELMRSLISWGAGRGAHTAYLQVMLNNPPALNLYAGLGFQERHRYWYRQKA